MKKIEELERRIRELEARPVYVPIYVSPPQPSYPCHQPAPWYQQPWYTSPPWTYRMGGIGAAGNMVTYNPAPDAAAPGPWSYTTFTAHN